MSPTYKSGDRVLVKNIGSEPVLDLRLKERLIGKVVLIEREGELLLKRVVRFEVGRHTTDGMVLVEGDNKEESVDSRIWGAIPASFIKGRVFGKLPF